MRVHGLAELVPRSVAVSERSADESGLPLLRAEAEAAAAAVPARRQEFATVRSCARDALAEIGIPPVALVPDERGAPCWPPGVVGSMTHCRGYRAAAVARDDDLAAVGIDAELHLPLPQAAAAHTLHPDEWLALAALKRSEPGVAWGTVMFSAKESAYKACHAFASCDVAVGEWAIELDPSSCRFVATLARGRRAGRLGAVEGRWGIRSGDEVDHVLTTVVVGHDSTHTRFGRSPIGRELHEK